MNLSNSHRRRLTLGLTAFALVAGGGAAIAAGQPDADVDSQPSGSATATATAEPVPGKAAFGRGGVLHSESVVSDGNGGFVTHLTQTGKVESLDSDRLTVVSADGYSRSWNRTSDTVVGGGGWSAEKNDDGSYTVKKATDELAVGDQVLVVGTLAKDVATAARIVARPDTGEVPGLLLKRFEGEFGGKMRGDIRGDGGPMLKDRLMPRPDGMPGGDVRRFEFRVPAERGRAAVPAPAPTEDAPSASAVPAEPGAVSPSGFTKLA